MKNVGPLLREAVDDFGEIRSVAVDDTDPVMLSIVNIVFEAGSLIIEALGHDDSIAFSETLPQDVRLHDVSDSGPWSSLIGGSAVWIWTLTNQQGFTDGVQLYVRTGRGDVILQLMVLASSLKPHTVTEEW